MRVIVGGPKTGKTTLAKQASGAVLATDEQRPLDWSGTSQRVADALVCRGGEATIEGVATARGLRKFLSQHPTARLDGVEVIVLNHPHRPLSPGQQRMHTGVQTVWREIADAVRARGATVRSG